MKKQNKNASFYLSQVSKQQLQDMYLVQDKTKEQIAKELKCGLKALNNKFQEFNIKNKKIKAHNNKSQEHSAKIKSLGFEILEEYKTAKKPIKLRCHCGKIFACAPGHIVSGHTKSCGCFISNNRPHSFLGYQEISGKLYSQYKRNAINRNLCFTISIEDIWDLYIKQQRKCAYTNIDLFWDSKEGLGNASIDRIDNKIGYTKNNIQIIIKDLNIMKNKYPHEYFLYLCHLCNQNHQDYIITHAKDIKHKYNLD